MLLAPGNEITPADLPTAIRKVLPGSFALPSPESIDESLHIPREWLSLPLAESREKLLLEFERAYLDGLLKATRGRIGQTARRAGIRERSLYDKMKRLGLKKEDYR
jgi:DNA-binding NtrC family response regulator